MIFQTEIKGGGTQPTGTKNITSNGVYDVTDFASADVQVPTTGPAYYIEKTKDANGVLQNGTFVMSFAGLTDVGNSVMKSAYVDNTNITGTVDLSGLTTISGPRCFEQTFSGCTGITSVDLSGLTTISGPRCFEQTFSGCTGITSVDLSGLTTITGNNACSYMFQGCISLTTVSFPSLTTVLDSSVFNQMLSNTTGVTVHFPSNFATTVTAATLGGTGTTVLYDLPAA